MENIIDDLNYRGLIEQYSNEEEVRELLSTPQTVYCGFDPSASSMHLGNFVMISLLMRFQKAGHRIVALVGGVKQAGVAVNKLYVFPKLFVGF